MLATTKPARFAKLLLALFVITQPIYACESEMKKIDENVKTAANAIESESNTTIKVLVSCDEDCTAVADQLKDQGAEVEQVIPELNVILVNIKNEHLELLESSKNVSTVELDQEVNTQKD